MKYIFSQFSVISIQSVICHIDPSLTTIPRKDLGRLEYLTQCIKEGMRLHSPVPGIMREIQAPIKVEDLEIPAKANVMISINSLHHNPTVWGEDHDQFKPERFSPENTEERDSFAFCPFSAGPRYTYTIMYMIFCF